MINKDFFYREAKVISVDDQDKIGRIKVRVYPELIDIDESMLPWAKPMNRDFSHPDSGEHNFPPVGSLVRVISEDDQFKRLYWVGADFIKDDDYIYDKLDLSSIDELTEQQTYPEPRFRMHPDGSTSFHNSETKESGFLHSSGAYVFFDKDGKIINSSSSIKHKSGDGLMEISNGAIIIKSGNNNQIKSRTKYNTDGSIAIENGNGSMLIDSSGKTTINGHLEIAASTTPNVLS